MFTGGTGERQGDMPSCVFLAAILSFIDLIPFFYICGRPPPHLIKSPPPAPLDTDNQQVRQSQTWSQLFAECSYQQDHSNDSESSRIVCSKVFDPLPVFFFAIAFALASALIMFNLITVSRHLTNIERVLRTIVHAVYAVELFVTALVYFINRRWCFDCKELIFICVIPIITTLFMPFDWRQCNGNNEQLRTILIYNRPVPRSLPSHHLTPSPLIMIHTEHAPSPPAPRRPSENNVDPQLENEYNEWLEVHQNNITERQ